MSGKTLLLTIDTPGADGALTIDYKINGATSQQVKLIGKETSDTALVATLFNDFFQGTALKTAYENIINLQKKKPGPFGIGKTLETKPSWSIVKTALASYDPEWLYHYNADVLTKIVDHYISKQKKYRLFSKEISGTDFENNNKDVFTSTALDIMFTIRADKEKYEDIKNNFATYITAAANKLSLNKSDSLKSFITQATLEKWATELRQWIKDITDGKTLRNVTTYNMFKGGAAQRTRKVKNYNYDDENYDENDE